MQKDLTVDEICIIIEKCSSCGVSNLKLGTFEISLKAIKEVSVESVEIAPSQDADINIDLEDEGNFEEENRNSKEEDFYILHLTDPHAFEEMIGNPEKLEQHISELTEGEDHA